MSALRVVLDVMRGADWTKRLGPAEPDREFSSPADPEHPLGATNGQIQMMGDAHHVLCQYYEWGPCTCSDLETRHLTAGLSEADAQLVRLRYALLGACESQRQADFVFTLGEMLDHWDGHDQIQLRAAISAAVEPFAEELRRATPLDAQDPDYYAVHSALYAVNNSLVYTLSDIDRRWEMTTAVERLVGA